MKLTFSAKRLGFEERVYGFGIKSYDEEMVILTEQGEIPVIPSSLRISGRNRPEKVKEPRMEPLQVAELHETIMSAALTYLWQHKIEGVDEIGFGADGLGPSIELGYWTPATDSSLYVYGYEDGEKKEIGCNI